MAINNSTPTCNPEMANRWEVPVARKSSTTWGGSWPLSPNNRAWANADWGTGRFRSRLRARTLLTENIPFLEDSESPPWPETSTSTRAAETTIPAVRTAPSDIAEPLT